MSTTARVAKWAGRKALGTVSNAARDRAARAKCTAQPHGPRLCHRRIRTGRLADGVTCGRELCQLWLLSHDEDAAAHYLGMSVEQMREQTAAARSL